ncbi:MAG: sodium:alanine symporter family protein [Victivallales bacterium]|nr:sodium:alanine symporter family protein [Victivallales bacterium]
MNTLYSFVCSVNSYLSDYVLITLLVFTGLFFTIRTHFVQVRCLGKGFKDAFSHFSLHGAIGSSGVSSLQALFTAIAAQVGTGNIVGASGAILTGGPGAIFWMWLIAFLGMATIYAEAILAQETRVKLDEHTIHGGPTYYMKKAFPNLFGKYIAVFFAVAAILSLGLIGCMVQANSIGEVCHNAFGVPTWSIGLVIAIISMLIFIGGLSRIAHVTEKLVPLMAVLYLVGGLILLAIRIRFIPETFAMIFKYAFNPEALIGGSIGYALKTAISQGVKRGLFSNEAGMGSTPHAHAMANVDLPHTQGIAAMVGVFIDTFVVLTMTALIVISTIYAGDGPLAGATGSTYTQLLESAGLQKTNLVQIAFASVSNATVGNLFVAVCLVFFALSTILSWNFFGKINFEYLFGRKYVVIYSACSIAFIFLGTVVKNDLVWELQDMFNQLMVLPNVLALIALSAIVAKAAR